MSGTTGTSGGSSTATTPGSIKEHATPGMPLVFLILGVCYYLIGYMNQFMYNEWLLAGTSVICLALIILINLGKFREEGIQNLIYLGLAIGFEIFYYTLLPKYANPIPWQLSKMLGWNGFMIAAGLSGFNKEKTYYKWIMYYFVILLMMILLSPLAAGLGKSLGWIPTTEVQGGSAEDVLKGIQETGTSWIDEMTCSISQSQDPGTCVEEKKWDKIRKDKPELAKAMIDLCKQNDPSCDCHVYPEGKDRDECVKTQTETQNARSLQGATKKLTPIKVDFTAINKESYSFARLDFSLDVTSPNKPIDIDLDCAIEYNKTKLDSDLEPKTNLRNIQTDINPSPRRYSCQSTQEVNQGDYKFNLTATIKGITTKATFIGLYTNLLPESRGPQFNTVLDGAMKDAYGGTSKDDVKSFSDPDPTLLIFKVTPTIIQDKVSILTTDPNYKNFILEVSFKKSSTGILENSKSKIKSVDSLEFKIPNVFNADKCTNVYDVTKGNDYTTISAKKDMLNNIMTKVTITQDPKVISELGCELEVVNPPPITLVKSLMFEGSMKYDQEISEQETVKRI